MIVDPDFCDHWKTRMLVGLLNGDEAAPVYVIRVWAHCQNRRQFVFDNLPSEALKALCRFPGNANKLESSLSTSGFVRRDGANLIVCGWDEYNKSLISAWANGTKGGRPPQNPRVTKRKPTGSREEKSRKDEIGNKKTKAVCSETSEADAAEPENPLVMFPVVGPEGSPKEWPLFESKVREYSDAYPGVDVLAEAKKARQWCVDNDTKRKTFKGMSKFLNSWMRRAQDDAGKRSGTYRAGNLFDQPQNSFQRNIARERQQLETLAAWASDEAVGFEGDGLQQGGFLEGDGPPVGDETHGGP